MIKYGLRHSNMLELLGIYLKKNPELQLEKLYDHGVDE